ncbi:MAG: phage holin family protein [Chloroflexales bacterium]|nr:phage holin family protein [Chloroflexales bacterium]
MDNQQSPQRESLFELRRLILRWLISTLAIFAAVWLVPGIEFTGPGWQLGIVAVVFGLLNALLRPLLVLLTCPLVILSLGLFGLVINALMLGLTSALAENLGIAFRVDGFWPAFFGGLVISLVSLLLNILAGEQRVVTVRIGGPPRDDR